MRDIVFSFLCLCFLLSLQQPVFGQNTDDFEFRRSISGITITGYTGSDKAPVIPEKINGAPVIKIGYQAFASRQLTGVSIPNSVKEIDTAAFYNNRLTHITLPDSLSSVGEVAFSYNRLTGVQIPRSVKTIGAEAFSENRIIAVSLPDNVDIRLNSFYLSLYDKYMRSGKKSSEFSITLVVSDRYEIAVLDHSVVEILGYHGNEKELVIPARINGMPVIAIGNRVFSHNHLTDVVIPNSVLIIGDDAFIHNKLTNVVIPNSVRIIGNGAFIDNEISNLILPDFIISIGNAAFTSNNISELVLPKTLVNIGFAAFSSNQLKKVTLPVSVKSVGEQAFDSSVKIKKANIFTEALFN